MSMVCPQCGTSYDQSLECANCKVRLLFQDRNVNPPVDPALSWQQTAWGRIVIGLVLAQGLYWGLRHLTTALVLGIGGDAAAGIWGTVNGLLLTQGLQALSLSFGAVLAGAGQRTGYFYGSILGLFSGSLCLMLQPDPNPAIPLALLNCTPFLQAGVGALMAYIGGRIWQPLPQVVTPGQPQVRPAKIVPQSAPRRNFLHGPIAWWRVMVGTAIAVSGTLLAGSCLELIESSGGRVETYSKESLLTGEIIALAMLTGSAFAGATTLNGIKQGLVTGVTTGIFLTGILFGQNKVSIDFIFLTAISAVVLGLVGGGFGSQLIPPLSTRRSLTSHLMDPT